MGKYQILWLNDDLRVNSSRFNLLDELRREAEMKFNLSIQTCVTGNDFIEFANDKKQIWDNRYAAGQDEEDNVDESIKVTAFKGKASVGQFLRRPGRDPCRTGAHPSPDYR